jgi:SCP-2 sterol transfer family
MVTIWWPRQRHDADSKLLHACSHTWQLRHPHQCLHSGSSATALTHMGMLYSPDTIMQGLVVFNIDGDLWTLDLRSSPGSVSKGSPADKPDLTLTISDDNFVKLVMGKLNPQQAFLLRKLKISGSMGLAMKLQPILDAAAPRAKL